MGSGADLFVVCKQCGSEVSPYVTECPYCGHRLRRRAPKLPRMHGSSRSAPSRGGLGGLLSAGARTRTRRSTRRRVASRWETVRPYATITIVAAACCIWVATKAEPLLISHMVVIGPLRGEWWRLLAYQFAYIEGGGGGVYAFVALLATGLFGWLLERRHGPAVVLTLYLGAGVIGALVAEVVYPLPLLVGGNVGALTLVAAWAAPDLRALRERSYYEGDLLGAGAFAVLLLALPFVRPEAGWLAGVIGAGVGLLAGLGLDALVHETA